MAASTPISVLSAGIAIMLGTVPCDYRALGQCEATELARCVASDGGGSHRLGWSVSGSADAVLAGAYGHDDNGTDSGAAYIFRHDGTNWVEEARLLPSDGWAYDYFGWSVSISGDVAVIGAYGNDDNGSNSGSAYVFRHDGKGWVEEAKLLASDGEAEDCFGWSVAVDGSTALIGAKGDGDHGSESGSAYVYQFDGTSWIETAKLLPSGGASGQKFGWSVSVQNDTVLIGAIGDDENGSDSGCAYVFRHDGSNWIEEARLLPSDGHTGDCFGWSVSISNDAALVGAFGNDDNGADSGSAYVFRCDDPIWTEEAKLLAWDGQAGDYFGWSVSICNDLALIGAYKEDHYGENSGSAYFFRFDGYAWTEQAKVIASDGAVLDYFGSSVAVMDQVAAVGAYKDDFPGNDSGSTYLFQFLDCNDNSVLDACDIANGISEDCQPNGIPDECDIDSGYSEDVNSNGVPDECDTPEWLSQERYVRMWWHYWDDYYFDEFSNKISAPDFAPFNASVNYADNGASQHSQINADGIVGTGTAHSAADGGDGWGKVVKANHIYMWDSAWIILFSQRWLVN